MGIFFALQMHFFIIQFAGHGLSINRVGLSVSLPNRVKLWMEVWTETHDTIFIAVINHSGRIIYVWFIGIINTTWDYWCVWPLKSMMVIHIIKLIAWFSAIGLLLPLQVKDSIILVVYLISRVVSALYVGCNRLLRLTEQGLQYHGRVGTVNTRGSLTLFFHDCGLFVIII